MSYIARIYKIVNNINDEIYVGSTRNELRVRWQGHKNAVNRRENGLYVMMREYGFEPFRIILIEEIEVRNKTEQMQHEQRYIDQLHPTLNKFNAHGTRCEHNRERYSCRDCDGSQICEHQRRRSQCKDCGGSQICEHDRMRSACRDCGGSQICEHDRIRSQCKDCGGSQICEHDRMRSACRDCGGSQVCEHNRERSKCRDCGGSQICEHNKRRSRCRDCHGSQMKPVYCADCDIETSKGDYKKHLKSAKHLRNTLPINL